MRLIFAWYSTPGQILLFDQLSREDHPNTRDKAARPVLTLARLQIRISCCSTTARNPAPPRISKRQPKHACPKICSILTAQPEDPGGNVRVRAVPPEELLEKNPGQDRYRQPARGSIRWARAPGLPAWVVHLVVIIFPARLLADRSVARAA